MKVNDSESSLVYQLLLFNSQICGLWSKYAGRNAEVHSSGPTDKFRSQTVIQQSVLLPAKCKLKIWTKT